MEHADHQGSDQSAEETSKPTNDDDNEAVHEGIGTHIQINTEKWCRNRPGETGEGSSCSEYKQKDEGNVVAQNLNHFSIRYGGTDGYADTGTRQHEGHPDKDENGKGQDEKTVNRIAGSEQSNIARQSRRGVDRKRNCAPDDLDNLVQDKEQPKREEEL